MLDQLSDTDLVQRKLAAKPANVAAPARHPAQEELEAYANGRLPAARVDFCRTHLESCDACRAELEDTRTLQTTLAAFPRPDANRFESNRRRRGSLALPITISAAAILVATGGIFFWWRHGSLPARKLSTAAPIARIPTPSPAPAAATAPAAPAAPAMLAAPAPAPTGFSLLSPATETTPEPRPQFKWQPLAGAIGYKVVIVDTGLHPIQHSPPIRATTWRPHRPLVPGRTYLWQVTATLHGGAQIVATSPTSSPAALRIVPATQASASGSRSHSHTR